MIFKFTDNELDTTPFDQRFGVAADQKEDVASLLEKYAWQELGALATDNPGLLVFPPNFKMIKDGIENQPLFKFHYRKKGSYIQTGNLVGMFGLHQDNKTAEVDFAIRSRFDVGERQYFLFYLLERVFGIHSVNLPTVADDQEKMQDLAVCLFPSALKAAMEKGVFRAYRTFYRNDEAMSGSLDVDRHIQSNIPFNGKVAYSSRERTADNDLMQLVRHTIEYLASGMYSGVVSSGREVRECVGRVRLATPSYVKGHRLSVIAKNLRPVRHPYYTEYTYLQKVCLKILRHELISYSSSARSEVNGIVFAVDWLWEEYLNTVLQENKADLEGFLSHPRNKDSKSGEKIHLFAPHRGVSYPDFMLREVRSDSPQDEFAILDAKYQRLSSESGEYTCVPRLDRLQMITYLHVTKARYGIFLFPMATNDAVFLDNDDPRGENVEEVGCEPLQIGDHVLGYECEDGGYPTTWIVPFVVPTYTEEVRYADFRRMMTDAEIVFVRNIKDILSGMKR